MLRSSIQWVWNQDRVRAGEVDLRIPNHLERGGKLIDDGYAPKAQREQSIASKINIDIDPTSIRAGDRGNPIPWLPIDSHQDVGENLVVEEDPDRGFVLELSKQYQN